MNAYFWAWCLEAGWGLTLAKVASQGYEQSLLEQYLHVNTLCIFAAEDRETGVQEKKYTTKYLLIQVRPFM